MATEDDQTDRTVRDCNNDSRHSGAEPTEHGWRIGANAELAPVEHEEHESEQRKSEDDWIASTDHLLGDGD